MIVIKNLYISPGHNFFGHHKKAAGTNPQVEVQEIECVAGRGIRGDRFFDFKENYKGQITFISSEVFAGLCRDLGLSGCNPGQTRRNAVTAGVDLNTLVGRIFEIQGVQFEGTGKCDPCYRMDEAVAPGAEKWLADRGGLRARILTDGILRVG